MSHALGSKVIASLKMDTSLNVKLTLRCILGKIGEKNPTEIEKSGTTLTKLDTK